jgi:hypothetical protein
MRTPDHSFYKRLDEGAERARELFSPDRWDFTRSEYRVMSQNGEDGVLAALFSMAGTTNRYFVEFGASDGIQGTCAFLAQVLGWSGLFIEPDAGAYGRLESRYADRQDIATVHAAVTRESIATIFDAEAVPAEPDLISIDVDGNDAHLLAVLPRRPRVIVVEYNGSLPRDPDVQLVQPYDERPWDGTAFFGASLGALEEVAHRSGYRLVHTELAGANAFFARDDVVLRDGLSPPRRPANYDLRGRQHPPDPEGREFDQLDP